MTKGNIAKLIEAYQKELDFINRTIMDLNKIISYYNNFSQSESDNVFLDIIKDDFDNNSKSYTSYSSNLEYFSKRKEFVEEKIEKLKSIKPFTN